MRRLLGGMVVVVFLSLVIPHANAGVTKEVAKLNQLLKQAKIETKVVAVEKIYDFTGTDKKPYKLYKVMIEDFRGVEQCCVALVVNPSMSKITEVPSYSLEVKVLDIDGNSVNEIETRHFAMGQGYEETTHSIWHFDGKQLELLHSVDGNSNRGVVGDESDPNFTADDVEFEYGKNSLIEKHTIAEAGKTKKTAVAYTFDGKKFTRKK